MIVHECMAGRINKKDWKGILIKQVNQILNKNYIKIDSLPEYGNMGLKKKEIEPCVKEKHLLMLLTKDITTHR